VSIMACCGDKPSIGAHHQYPAAHPLHTIFLKTLLFPPSISNCIVPPLSGCGRDSSTLRP
jgi:hypothetical protein